MKSIAPILSFLFLFAGSHLLTAQTERPNILWITSEDNGPQLGCYGDTYADTPNIDRLAERGQIYLNAWSNAPVCAPARTTIITGMYPTSLGAQHMRSSVRMPKEFMLYPQLFKQQGYYTTNNVKEDYNIIKPKDAWDESSAKAHWRKRKAGQPFFAVFNFVTTHESQIRDRPHKAIHDASKVKVPPYHPDLPEVRQDWAQYYDKLTEMDAQVGEVLAQLRQDNLDDSTIVVYYGDHGCGLPRGKRWLYQSGLHVPLIVSVPPRYQHLVQDGYKSGSQEARLVSFVDLAPTMLSIIGVRPPANMQGNAFLGKHASKPRQYNYGFRDRMDERIDMSRAVRDDRFLYIRNFFPQRPQGTYLNYMFQTPTTQKWKEEFDAGRLNAAQAFFWKEKPAEELYDITADPYQINNVAADPAQAQTLERMRGALQEWMISICDTGLLPEGEFHGRSGDDAPYTMAHDEKRFQAEALYKAADLASRPSAGSLEQLLALRSVPEAGVRYWTANGLLVRACDKSLPAAERSELVKAARGMLNDSSPYVRALAAETVARFGETNDRTSAIRTLVDLSSADRHNLFVAVQALNSLDWAQPTRSEVGDGLKDWPQAINALGLVIRITCRAWPNESNRSCETNDASQSSCASMLISISGNTTPINILGSPAVRRWFAVFYQPISRLS